MIDQQRQWHFVVDIAIKLFIILHAGGIDAMQGPQAGTFGSTFTNAWGPPGTIYGSAGVLVGSRVIIHVGHSRGNGSCDGTIRNIKQQSADSYEYHWTGQFYQHPLYSSDTSLYDFAVIILDAPIPNLCVSPDSPRALPLPFNVTTNKVIVSTDSLMPNVTKCRHYGYGYPDLTYLQLGFSTHNGIVGSMSSVEREVYLKQIMNVGSLCNGDSGGPMLCKIGCEWRLMGLNKGIQEPCGTVSQDIVANIFVKYQFRDFFRLLLQQHNLIDDVAQSQQKCANVAFAWESDSEPICNNPVSNTIAPVGLWIFIKCNNGMYMTVEEGTNLMWCKSQNAGQRERFTVVYAGNGKVALKSVMTQKYVTSEYGYYEMHCNKDAINLWEYFKWIDNGDGTFSLRNDQNKLVSSENGQTAMWCNKDVAYTWERFQMELAPPIGRVVRIKCNNGMYMGVEAGTDLLWCKSPIAGDREKFYFIDLGNGNVAFKSNTLGKWATSDGGQSAMHCNKDAITTSETFKWIANTDGTFSLRNGAINKLVSSENGQTAMWCNKDVAYTWERFQFEILYY